MELGVAQPTVELDVEQSIPVPIGLGSGFIPPSNQVTGEVNGVPTPLTLWMGNVAQYSAISPKDPSTIYIVTA